MNLVHLASFVIFAKHLNIKNAADELYMTQPTLHAQLKALGKEMGGALYHKKGRSLALTQRGILLEKLGRHLLDQAQWIQSEIKSMTQAQVCLSIGSASFESLLAPFIHKYLKNNDVSLKVYIHSRSHTLQALRSGIAHLGFTHIPPEGFKDLSHQVLYKSKMVLLIHKTHVFAKMKSIHPQDLDQCDLIFPPHPSPHRRWVEGILEKASSKYKSSIEISGWSLMASLVNEGIGMAIVPDFCQVPKHCISKPLQGFDEQSYGLVYDERFEQLPAVKELMRQIVLFSAL